MAGAVDEQCAEAALVVLVERVLSHEFAEIPITYMGLARLIAFPKPHTGSNFAGRIGRTLAVIGARLESCEVRGEPVPRIQSLVVSKSTGIPGDGFAGCRRGYQNLPAEEKRRIAEQEQKKVYEFGGKWLEVLEQLDISYRHNPSRCV